MPEEEKKTVDIDTSGPDTEVDIPEEKDQLLKGVQNILNKDPHLNNKYTTHLAKI